MVRKWLGISTILFLLILITLEASAFEIDLSRRRKKTTDKEESKIPSTVSPRNSVTDFFSGSETKQEIVILNTDRGFVPSKLSVKKGFTYTVHVVNVNLKEKNVSFILDAFSEHHSTFYGNIT